MKKMRVLWFNISVPEEYKLGKNKPIAGWQDSLQKIVLSHNEVELAIAFENEGAASNVRQIDNVKYYPINTSYNLWERQRKKAGWTVNIEKTIPQALDIINEFNPDIIHVFGSEWSFGLVAGHTKIPVVIHVQGIIQPYNNALMPPKYSVWDLIFGLGCNLHRQFNAWLFRKRNISRQKMERKILETVRYYMGRTEWDKNLVQLFHPGCKYYYCSEALRPVFVKTIQQWKPVHNKKFRIVTTGISTFWKGIETILRTAHILKGGQFDFEWYMIGEIPPTLKQVVEKKENLKYEENNCIITGFLEADKLQDLLLTADLYVHTAYIDNSPNALCEAQYLGLPIIATYVGGIPSLIENGKEGILVPANAPYTLACKIIELSKDEATCMAMGKASRCKAIERHNPDYIYRDLINCYESIIADGALK